MSEAPAADAPDAPQREIPRVLCLLFHVGDERYALPALDVHKVVEPPWVNRLPRLPPFVAGITQHRGRVLTVVDLATFFGRPPRPFVVTSSTRVLVLDRGQRNLGLWVDAVDQIASMRLPLPREGAPMVVVGQQGAAIAALSATALYERIAAAPGEDVGADV